MAKNKKKKATMLSYIGFVIFIIIIYMAFSKAGLVKKDLNSKVFVIDKGQGLSEIGDNLEDQGVIKNDKIFELTAFLKNVKNKFLPGEYELKSGMSLNDLIKTLTSPSKAKEVEVTILEGANNLEIANKLEDHNLLSKEDFFNGLKEMSQDEQIFNKYEFLTPLTIKNDKREIFQGFLFPDTYNFYKKANARHIIEKMLNNFLKKVYIPLKKEIEINNHSFYDVLTLSSIIEKEMNQDRERRLAADVFWDRLKINWALQSDATINYILNTKKLQPSFKDTRTPSPYNTYTNPGLPPGPINNPSFSSIKATLDPIENDYCCFLVTPDGENLFSKTIEEHNRKKAKYWGD